MKRKIVIQLFFLFTILAACSKQERLIFTGGSENWTVHYEAIVEGSQQQTSYHIAYIGKESIPKQIDYTIEEVQGSTTGTVLLDENGVVGGGGDFCSGCAVVRKDQMIKVKIEWNGKSDSFTLATR